jgi:type VI protein secretion system component Hcp
MNQLSGSQRILVAAMALMLVIGAPTWGTSPAGATAPSNAAGDTTPTAIEAVASHNLAAAIGTDAWFVKFGALSGEVTEANHRNWTYALAVDWSMDKPARNTTVLNPIVVSMDYDVAATRILKTCDTRGSFGSVSIDMAETGQTQQIHTKYRLSDVTCLSYQISGTADQSRPIVAVLLMPQKSMLVTYQQYGPTGQLVGKVAHRIDIP